MMRRSPCTVTSRAGSLHAPNAVQLPELVQQRARGQPAHRRQREPDCRRLRVAIHSSAGVPASRTRPARIATTRSHSASASSSSWVTSRTVVPASCSRRTAAHTSRRAAGSRPWVSSSRMTSRGRLSSASTRNKPLPLAAAERGEHRATAGGQPELFKQLVAVRSRPTVAKRRQRLGHAQPVGQRRVLQLAADQRPQLRCLGGRVVAEHAQRAGVRTRAGPGCIRRSSSSRRRWRQPGRRSPRPGRQGQVRARQLCFRRTCAARGRSQHRVLSCALSSRRGVPRASARR